MWARADQLPPEDDDWETWLLLGGRGAGKTRTGAEFIRNEVRAGAGYVGLIAPTAADARDVMVEGESGLLSVCHRSDRDYKGNLTGRPHYEPSKRQLTWKNGAKAKLYSAEEPERLRGPQHSVLWMDELAAWKYLVKTYDMAQFGNRLVYASGRQPRQVITTTPKPLALLRTIIKDLRTRISKARTYDNAANLSSKFIARIREKYEGTRLGRQELDAELLDDIQGALWTLDSIAEARVTVAPKNLRRVVIGVDPSGSTENGDEIGIIAAGEKPQFNPKLGAYTDHGYILGDYSLHGSPATWARAAVRAYRDHKADMIVAEKNYGGEMVRHTIHSIDNSVTVKLVNATRGKVVRAEPVATFYEQRRVHHVEVFPELESQLIQFTPLGYMGDDSPDRADAAVWALTELMLGVQAQDPLSGTSGRTAD